MKKITIKKLLELKKTVGMCWSGLIWFQNRYPEGVYICEKEVNRALAKHECFVTWLPYQLDREVYDEFYKDGYGDIKNTMILVEFFNKIF